MKALVAPGPGRLVVDDVVAAGPGVTGIAAGDRVTCGTAWGAHAELLAVDAATVHVLPPGLSYLDGACAYWAAPSRSTRHRPTGRLRSRAFRRAGPAW